MNERVDRKRLFLGTSNHRIPDEDPPWALKFPSDVRVMVRDIRTNERVRCAVLDITNAFYLLQNPMPSLLRFQG